MTSDIFNLEMLLKLTRQGKRHKYIFFWGHRRRKDGQIGKQCFSQWWPSTFRVDGHIYSSAEHFMMAEKARLFGDENIRARIMDCRHPNAAKKLGREIVDFQEGVWREHRFDIVVRGNQAKFEQNDELKTFLLATGKRVLVESSPVDRIWGIGLAADDPRASNLETWNGLNLLGFALMKVRSLLRTTA